eukprot:gb/GECH01003850.1/.p1 GENE.gb/GECH01003850.1/~~gb/GECH01003850.1/.p1  ORF type:complete len:445 (+),score=130.06 gb/GECH01003850.1/:1-1335(+)
MRPSALNFKSSSHYSSHLRNSHPKNTISRLNPVNVNFAHTTKNSSNNSIFQKITGKQFYSTNLPFNKDNTSENNRSYHSTNKNASNSHTTKAQVSEALEKGPSLDQFIGNNQENNYNITTTNTTNTSNTTTNKKKRAFRSQRLPEWLKRDLPSGETYHELKRTVRSLGLSTVCEEAKCPNIGECWSGGTATIMLMGDTCTRGCRFCAIKTSKAPPPLDTTEPEHVAQAVSKWGLEYVVLTSVDRDDLDDGGAEHFAETVEYLKAKTPSLMVECLAPDFSGSRSSIQRVVNSGLNVFAHNMETVEDLTPYVRDRRAKYRQSLDVLEMAKKIRPSVVTKTSLMLGLGETDNEVEQTLRDLRNVGVEIVTFGQYLQPTKKHMKVAKYVTPEEFERWKKIGEDMGFAYVASGPFVRSSYRAGELFTKAMLKERQEKEREMETLQEQHQ